MFGKDFLSFHLPYFLRPKIKKKFFFKFSFTVFFSTNLRKKNFFPNCFHPVLEQFSDFFRIFFFKKKFFLKKKIFQKSCKLEIFFVITCNDNASTWTRNIFFGHFEKNFREFKKNFFKKK